jgi:hypothetical protein
MIGNSIKRSKGLVNTNDLRRGKIYAILKVAEKHGRIKPYF